MYEQAPVFSRIGAGIILSANVMKVLLRLGQSTNSCKRASARMGETLYELTLDAATARTSTFIASEARFGEPGKQGAADGVA